MSRAAVLVKRVRSGSDDAGFTLVELIVASVIGLVVGGLVLSTLMVAQRSVSTTTAASDLNGEARDLLNRMAGDLRQATPVFNTDPLTHIVTETPAVTDVQNPEPFGVSGGLTSITFDADFSGDNCVDGLVSDVCASPPSFDQNYPETETFCWDPAVDVVYLIAGGVQHDGHCTPAHSGVSAQPLLSGKVTDLEIECDSNSYLYDADHNGVTTWKELDSAASPVGNGDNALDAPELPRIDSLKIVVKVFQDGHSQTYQTLVSLRNVS